jgi:hypothetical protein
MQKALFSLVYMNSMDLDPENWWCINYKDKKGVKESFHKFVFKLPQNHKKQYSNALCHSQL